MEVETTKDTYTPGRGNPESAAWMRAKLDELGIGPSTLARRMLAAGDDRMLPTILRSIQRQLSGEARVSGEMRALLCVLGEAAMYQNEVAGREEARQPVLMD